MTISFDPFRQMDRLTRELLSQGTQDRGMSWMPMDVYREGDHFIANIDLPGVDPGSIDVDVEGNLVTVRAQRSVRGEGTEWLSQERPSGSFMRQLTMGEGIDVDNIHANYEHGVLSLTIPVAAAGSADNSSTPVGVLTDCVEAMSNLSRSGGACLARGW